MADDKKSKKEEKKKEEKKEPAEKKEEKQSEAKPAEEAEKKADKKADVKLSKKAQEILKAVEEMSVLELNELVKALEDKFGVSAAPVAAAVPAAGGEVAGDAGEEKSEYDVVLAATGENKISAIKAVREINQNLGLKEAKELVESVPKPVLEAAKKEDAEEAKKKLESAGCKVELK